MQKWEERPLPRGPQDPGGGETFLLEPRASPAAVQPSYARAIACAREKASTLLGPLPVPWRD
eukprot:3118819-Pyramimonas_sp.AAC.2